MAMVRGYILVTLNKAGIEKEVVQTLRKMPGVKYADVVYGVFDVITMVEGDTLADLGKVIDTLRAKTAGVEKTATLIAKEEFYV